MSANLSEDTSSPPTGLALCFGVGVVPALLDWEGERGRRPSPGRGEIFRGGGAVGKFSAGVQVEPPPSLVFRLASWRLRLYLTLGTINQFTRGVDSVINAAFFDGRVNSGSRIYSADPCSGTFSIFPMLSSKLMGCSTSRNGHLGTRDNYSLLDTAG